MGRVLSKRSFAGCTHGQDGTYHLGCRCTPCEKAHSAAMADYRMRKKVGAVGPRGLRRDAIPVPVKRYAATCPSCFTQHNGDCL